MGGKQNGREQKYVTLIIACKLRGACLYFSVFKILYCLEE